MKSKKAIECMCKGKVSIREKKKKKNKKIKKIN